MKDTKPDVKVESEVIPICPSCDKPLNEVVVEKTRHTDDWYQYTDGQYVFNTTVVDEDSIAFNCGNCNHELFDKALAWFKEKYAKGLLNK